MKIIKKGEKLKQEKELLLLNKVGEILNNLLSTKSMIVENKKVLDYKL